MMRLLRSRAPQIRSFTQASPFLAARPPSQSLPPMPSFKAPTTSIPTKAKKPARAPRPPPPPQHFVPPPKPVQHSSQSSGPQSYASGLLGDAKSVLLYKGPRNVALFTTCFITGSSLFFWIGTVANGAFMEYTVPLYAKAIVIAGCLVGSAIATAVATTPHHLVKSISVVRNAEKGAMLRVKGTRFFPFMKPAVFDVAPGELKIDSNVTMSLENGRQWYDVPLKNATVWTEGGLQRPDAIEGNAFQRFNKRLLNIAPAMSSQTKKMFNREGMAYVNVEGRNWKMDLSACEILENGLVLMKLARVAPIRTDLTGMLLNRLAGNK